MVVLIRIKLPKCHKGLSPTGHWLNQMRKTLQQTPQKAAPPTSPQPSMIGILCMRRIDPLLLRIPMRCLPLPFLWTTLVILHMSISGLKSLEVMRTMLMRKNLRLCGSFGWITCAMVAAFSLHLLLLLFSMKTGGQTVFVEGSMATFGLRAQAVDPHHSGIRSALEREEWSSTTGSCAMCVINLPTETVLLLPQHSKSQTYNSLTETVLLQHIMPTTFQENWMHDPRFKAWVQKDPKSRYHARCRFCPNTWTKPIDISSMGASGLRSHASGKGHNANVKTATENVPVASSFSSGHKTISEASGVCSSETISAAASSRSETVSAAASSRSETVSAAASSRSETVSAADETSSQRSFATTFRSKEAALDAELYYVMNMIQKNQSFSSANGSNVLFQKMFTDSNIANDYECHETKSSYLTNFALGPYISNIYAELSKGEKFVICFDESLNVYLHKKQMDFHIRMWLQKGEDTVVSTRYLTSAFLGKSAAVDIVDAFKSLPISLAGMVQVSMDGPNVNLKAQSYIDQYMYDDFGYKLLNIGTCGLHQIHNAFKGSFMGNKLEEGSSSWHGAEWDIGKFLSALFNLFNEAPARRADYETVTESRHFPLPFCSHRWLENIKPADRAIVMIPFLSKYIKAVQESRVSKPHCASFDTVKSFLDDPLAMSKLSFFAYIASPIEQFLQKSQSDSALAPYLSDELEKLLHGLLRKVVKRDELAKLSTLETIKKLTEPKLKRCEDVELGIQTTELLKKCKASERQKLGFYMDCRKAVVFFLKKICVKSPLSHSLTEHLACLNPQLFCTDSDQAVFHFKKCVQIMVSKFLVSPADGDPAVEQFEDFVTEAKKLEQNTSFRPFAKEGPGLDSLLAGQMSNYPKAWDCVKVLLLLSHSQATVERGFSINKEIIGPNLSEITLINRRLVKDYLSLVGGAVKVDITPKLRGHARQAYHRYKRHLEDQREQKVQSEKDRKRKSEEEELQALKKRKESLLKDARMLMDECFILCDKSETTGCRSFLLKGNALRRSSKEKEVEAENVGKLISSFKFSHT